MSALAAEAAKAVQTEANRIFKDRWERLGPAQRQYLTVVAQSQWENPARGELEFAIPRFAA